MRIWTRAPGQTSKTNHIGTLDHHHVRQSFINSATISSNLRALTVSRSNTSARSKRAAGSRHCVALPVGSSFLGRAEPCAGLAIPRQTFVRRCHCGGDSPGFFPARSRLR